jgi:hypothetical protein
MVVCRSGTATSLLTLLGLDSDRRDSGDRQVAFGPVCAALIIQMIVAITTVRLAMIPAGLSFLDWLDDFLYLPETMYIIILMWVDLLRTGKSQC